MKKLTEKDYSKYMKVIDNFINDTTLKIKLLPKMKEIRKLNYEEWCKFQNGEKHDKKKENKKN